MTHTDRVERSVPVAIVGAGPVGLSLAIGLARHGVRSMIFERKSRTGKHSKAAVVHLRTREIFRLWGIEERFLRAGMLMQTLKQHNVVPGRPAISSLDFTELSSEADRPGILMLEQSETESLLLEALEETESCEVRFNAEVVELMPDENGVALAINEQGKKYVVRAEYVVGCDGASSFVRNALDLPFEGTTYSLRPMLADVRVEDGRDGLPWPRVWNGRDGITASLRLRPGLWRVVRLEGGEATKGENVSEKEVERRVEEVLGNGPADVVWASRFRIHKRSSPRFRMGRVLLAGDAAHIHSPAGGLGMNAGIQDAHNLAWKLAYALEGGDEDRLLDSYEVERQAVVVESVSHFTDIVTRLFLQAPAFIREIAFALYRWGLKIGPLHRKFVRRLTMIDFDYPGSPLIDTHKRSAGIRLPNPVLQTPEGKKVRLYDVLPVGAVLLDVADERPFAEDVPLDDVIRIGPGAYHDPTRLLRELLGGRDGWILVRPDAHVAWASHTLEGIDGDVHAALGRPGDRVESTSLGELGTV